MENKIAKNRKSPANEESFRQNYMKLNPKAKKADGLDISAVVTKNGTKGYGLLSEEFNRSHSKDYHIVKDFISDEELKAVTR